MFKNDWKLIKQTYFYIDDVSKNLNKTLILSKWTNVNPYCNTTI